MTDNEVSREDRGQDMWKRGDEGNGKSLHWKFHLGSDAEIAKNCVKTSVRTLE